MKIIAEIGINHNGGFNTAWNMIADSVLRGADMLKFQIYQKETFHLLPSLLHHEYVDLFNLCNEYEIPWFATCFDKPSMDFVQRHGQKIWKIPSGLVTDDAYTSEVISRVNQTNGQLFISTGISTWREVKDIVRKAHMNLAREQVELFHCVSEYPTQARNLNLELIYDYQKHFGTTRVSLSDHSKGVIARIAAVMAVAIGCNYLEKHVTFDAGAKGLDHGSSLTLTELKELVDYVRYAEEMMGSSEFKQYDLPKWLNEKAEAIVRAMEPVKVV
jgi:N-acetylneuraminate synthase